MVKVDLRTVTLNIPPQEVITRDNVPSSVNAVAYFRVVDSNRAIVEVENYLLATSQIAQTALRSVLGKAELDQLLSERERLNEELQKIIDESTEPWGVKVTAVEIKDVEIPEQMQRAMARQAEAERERRAKIINSEGEYQAAQKLTDAADIISTNPASPAAALPADAARDRQQPEHDGRLPAADGRARAVPRRENAESAQAARRRSPAGPTLDAGPAALPLLSAPSCASTSSRAAGDPGARTGRSAGQLQPPSSEPEGAGELPLLRGTRGPHAARGLRDAARRRRGRHARAGRRGSSPTSIRPSPTMRLRVPRRPLTTAREPGGDRRRGGCLRQHRRSAARLAALRRTRPLRRAPGARRPRGDRQRARARDRDGRARARSSSPSRWPPGASGCVPMPRPPTCS